VRFVVMGVIAKKANKVR